MPSEHSPGGRSRDRYDDEHKQTAQRWLDRDLQHPGGRRTEWGVNDDGYDEMRVIPDSDVSSEWACVQSIIDSLRTVAEVEAWLTVENDLGRSESGGARPVVIEALGQRRADLEAPEEPNPRQVGPTPSTDSSVTFADRDGGSRSSTYMQSDHDIETDAQAHQQAVREERRAVLGSGGDAQ